MLRLDILMMVGNINYINKFLFKNNRKNLKKLKDKEIDGFISWYLSHNHDENIYDRYAVYFYLDEAIRKIGTRRVETLVIESDFFESKPVEEIAYYFKILHNLEVPELKKMKRFTTYLTSKITKSYDLIELINNRVDIDYDYAFKSLVEVQNVHYLITYIKALIRQDNKKRLAEAIVSSKMYSLDDLKMIFLEARLAPSVIVDLFINIYNEAYGQEDKDSIIVTFNSLIEATQYRKDNDREFDNFEEGYKGYTYQMSLASNMPLGMRNDISRKLLETKNYEFIYEWFLKDIKCEFNYDIISNLILEGEDVVANILICVNDRYLEYAVKGLLNRDREFISRVIDFIFTRVIDFDIEQIDKILAMIYAKYSDFKLSKEVAFILINHKSKYIPKYISEYEFSAEEEARVDEIYNWAKIFSLIYESYINRGDNPDLLFDINEVEKVLNGLRLERRQ